MDDMQMIDDHASRMRTALAASGLNQSEVAAQLGVGQSTVSQWLKGTRRPDRSALEQFAAAVGASPAWLDYGQGTGPSPDLAADRIAYRKDVEWIFTHEREDGSRDFGNANIFSFNPDIGTFTREVLQNVGDAAIGGHAHATFTIRRLRGADLDAFLEVLQWDDFSPHLKASFKSGQQVGSALETGLRAVESRELLLMEVADSGTTGLLGAEFDKGKFTALCRNNLDSNNSASAGGSYGLGKAVLWRMSSTSTVLFMSNLAEPAPDSGQTSRRFIARSELVWHDIEGDRAYAGPGWLATKNPEEPRRPLSYWNNAALAQDLHFSLDDTSTGTSIIVVGFHDPSSDAEQTPEQLAEHVESAVVEHFWPALASGELSVTVRVAEGREIRRTVEVDADASVPDLADLLGRHRQNKIADGLFELGDVVRIPVKLEVPACVGQDREHPAFDHTAFVLLRRADPTENSPGVGKAQYFRGTGMVIMQPDLSRILVGAQPFHVAVLCGSAAGESRDDERAEVFLRTAEPPKHDRWELTDKLGRDYARGGGAAITRFTTAVRQAVKDALIPATDHPKDGPRDLAALFRLGNPRPPERASRLVVDSAFVDENGAWQVEGTIRVGTPTKRVLGRPVVVFLGETGGGRKVKWATLDGDEKTCRAEGDVLVIEKGHRTARFRGVTDPSDHPVPTAGASITIDFRAVREGADV